MTTRQPRIEVPSLLRFERQAIAAALNLIEDRRPDRQEQAFALLDELAALPAPAHFSFPLAIFGLMRREALRVSRLRAPHFVALRTRGRWGVPARSWPAAPRTKPGRS